MRRMTDFLELVEETLGNRNAVIWREITKIHEEFIRGEVRHLREKADKICLKGEATLLIQGDSHKSMPF